MTLSALGDSALVLSLSEEVNDLVSVQVRAVADALRAESIAGVVDVVPAFGAVTVFFDISRVGGYSRFEARLAELAGRAADSAPRPSNVRTVEIPVCYDREFGFDLDEVAAHIGTTSEQAIDWHVSAEYRVHAIGFVPGFGYLGGLPRKLNVPRRATPRPSVAAGSVGVGGALTGVYPVATPGGWNIIGRSPLRMFDPLRDEPATLRAGDRVRFRRITREEFAAWK
jgi:inhibitor of KinA